MDINGRLFQVANALCGRVDTATLRRSTIRSFVIAVVKWIRLERVLLRGSSEVHGTLSFDQQHSFRILHDYLRGAYQDSEPTLHFCSGWEELQNEYAHSTKDELHSLRKILKDNAALELFDDVVVRNKASRVRDERHGASYVRSMCLLFFSEFVYGDRFYTMKSGYHQSSSDLQDIRADARVRAWCQEIAMKSFRSVAIRHPDMPQNLVAAMKRNTTHSRNHPATRHDRNVVLHWPLEAGPANKVCDWLQCRESDDPPGLPYYLWDRNYGKTVCSKDMRGRIHYLAISHTWGRWRKRDDKGNPRAPVKVAGVPWRVPENTRFEVTELGARFAHLPSGLRYLWIDLFCVPQETTPETEAIKVSEIARQAQTFQNAEHAVAWINDIPDVKCLSLVAQYMAFYLLEFDRFSAADSLKLALCGQLLEAMEGRSTHLTNMAGNRGHNIAPIGHDGEPSSTNFEVNSWFSSLWTLQELCLRPDMWLCGTDWKLLSLNQRDPLPLNGLVAICTTYHDSVFAAFDQFKDHGIFAAKLFVLQYILRPYILDHRTAFERVRGTVDSLRQNTAASARILRKHIGWGSKIWSKMEYPLVRQRAYAQLMAWLQSTGLERLPHVRRIEILTIGDRRECRSRRAEATMSALGVTGWYHRVPHNFHEADLVMGKYPLPFVQELKDKDPGEFFGSFVASNSMMLAKKDNPQHFRLPESNVLLQEHGSMLPFSGKGTKYGMAYHILERRDGYKSHSSLHAWTINTDGSVHIRNACVVESSRKLRTKSTLILSADILGIRSPSLQKASSTPPNKWKSMMEEHFAARYANVDLRQWIHSRAYEIHALLLRHKTELELTVRGASVETTYLDGIFIVKIVDDDADRMAKFGHFNARCEGRCPLPPEETVDWIVC